MLRLSVAEIFNFNLFGIPMVGSDICGFEGDTTPELCARWMQVGAFYPFSRNHNSIFMKPQEPYVFRDYPFVLQSSLTSLQIRYSLLKYYYTLFVKNDGKGTVFRPLFFEFPE
jgi:alpha-glucosidase